MHSLERIVVAMMFVRLSGMGVHCDHTVHISADLSLWLDTYSQPCFSSSTWKRGGMDVQTRRDISRMVDISYY